MTNLNDQEMFNNLEDWLEAVNFKCHPFKQLVGDTDKNLGGYFQQFKYFEDIEGPQTSFLFLKRGSGKSTNREFLRIQCDKSLADEEEPKLGVVYTDFHQLIQNEQVTLADHVEEILSEAVPRLFKFVTEQGKLDQLADKEYKKDFVWFITRYTERLSLDAIKEQIQGIEGYDKLLQKSVVKLPELLAKFSEGTMAKPIFGMASAILNSLETDDAMNLLEQTNRSPLDKMRRFADIAQQFGLKHIYILIDRVDEYAQIYDYAKSANMLKPLLASIPLLEMQPYAFKFFLPSEMRLLLADHLRSDRFIIRDDKDYRWTEIELKQLLKNRLEHCSDKQKIHDEAVRGDFVRLFDTEVSQKYLDIVADMIQYANHSPRDLLKLARMIFDDHTRSEEFPFYISLATYERVLVRFAVEQLELRAMDEPSIGKLTQLKLAGRPTLAKLLNDKGVRDVDKIIKEVQQNPYLYVSHFGLNDIIQFLGVSRSEARKIATEWEDKGLVSTHYQITDNNLAQYLFIGEKG